MTADERWDLTIVGAGPAGAATALGALAADPTLRVLLLDRAEFPRDKSCGDGIAPHVFDALADVGVHDVADGWDPVRRLSIGQPRTAVERPPARPVWVIPRQVFDARLVDHAVRAGATLRRHRVRDIDPTGTHITVDAAIRTRLLVGADGAYSTVRRLLGAQRSGRQALAIRGYAPTPTARAGRQVIVYGTRRQPSYAWSFDRGDGWCNVGYGELVNSPGDETLTRSVLLDQLDELLPGATEGVRDLRGHHLPLSSFGWTHPGGRLLLAGDAAHLINPMTGEGIYYAVATGIIAGRSAVAALATGHPSVAGDTHRAGVRRLLAHHLRHTYVASRLSARPTVVEAGIHAATRRRAVFDDLVEIGLGGGLITPRLLAGLAHGLATGPVRRRARAARR